MHSIDEAIRECLMETSLYYDESGRPSVRNAFFYDLAFADRWRHFPYRRKAYDLQMQERCAFKFLNQQRVPFRMDPTIYFQSCLLQEQQKLRAE